jgi:hypothetical protein
MVVLMVALMGGSAFAIRYDSTYATFSGSPHGQYSTATTKCAACHAVHNPGQLATSTVSTDKESLDHATRQTAMGSSEVLLRGTIANACTYCHITGPFSIKKVYAANAANYTTASGFGHTSNGAAMSDAGVNCVDCHQVHGASALMASTTDLYMYRKILKSQAGYDSDAPAVFAPNASTTTVNGTNMSKWCSGCHGYYETDHNQNSHIMAAFNTNFKTGPGGNAAANYDGQVAWAASTYCRSCHQAGVTNAAAASNGANNFPHFTGGYRFLFQANSSSGATADAAAPSTAGQPVNDGTCLICHATGVAGAGVSF